MRKPVLVWHTAQFVAQLELGIPAKLNIHAIAVSLSSHHFMERHQSQLRVFWLLRREAAARVSGHHHLHRAGRLKEDEPWDSWFPLQSLEGDPFLNTQRLLPLPCLWPIVHTLYPTLLASLYHLFITWTAHQSQHRIFWHRHNMIWKSAPSMQMQLYWTCYCQKSRY